MRLTYKHDDKKKGEASESVGMADESVKELAEHIYKHFAESLEANGDKVIAVQVELAVIAVVVRKPKEDGR